MQSHRNLPPRPTRAPGYGQESICTSANVSQPAPTSVHNINLRSAQVLCWFLSAQPPDSESRAFFKLRQPYVINNFTGSGGHIHMGAFHPATLFLQTPLPDTRRVHPQLLGELPPHDPCLTLQPRPDSDFALACSTAPHLKGHCTDRSYSQGSPAFQVDGFGETTPEHSTAIGCILRALSFKYLFRSLHVLAFRYNFMVRRLI
jgi:hypothetical protein